jgi:hypothetical protein
MLHRQFDHSNLLSFAIEREAEIGDRPYVKGAPEECELRGWLFRRSTPR